jgi:hypothetical protein
MLKKTFQGGMMPGELAAEQSSGDRGRLPQTLSVTYIAIDKLRPNSNNPRIHTNKQIRQIARSIQAHGFTVPVLVDRNLQVIAGHGRLRAARRLGMDLIPVIVLEHLSSAQAISLMIADNKLSENSSWNERLVVDQIKSLSEVELNFSLEATGFDLGEIDVLIDGPPSTHEDDRDTVDSSATEKSASPVTKPGDLSVTALSWIPPMSTPSFVVGGVSGDDPSSIASQGLPSTNSKRRPPMANTEKADQDTGDAAVGYRRPPVPTRFKKGRSGNPNWCAAFFPYSLFLPRPHLVQSFSVRVHHLVPHSRPFPF